MKFEQKHKRNEVIEAILEALKDKELSIVDLQQKLQMKRSTLIYYLNLLADIGSIEKRRVQKKMTGRPTLIKIPKEKRAEVKREKTRKDSYKIEILRELKKRGGEMKLKDFHTLVPFDPTKKDARERFNATLNIQYSPFVEHIIRLSEEGKEFLKNHKSK